MTASLYQSGSTTSALGLGRSASIASWCSSGIGSPVYKEDMRGKRVRVEFDVVLVPLPRIAPAPQQVLHLERLAAEAELDPARLHEAGVEVDDDENQVVAFLLRIRDQLVVIDLMEPQAPVRLQRRIFFSHPVQLANKRAERIGTIRIPNF